MSTYLDFSNNGLVFMHPCNTKMVDDLEELSERLQNPYVELYHWAKGEVFDIFSVFEVVKQCQTQVELTKSLRQKLQQAQIDLKDIGNGNTTLSTLFKNTGDKTALANKIDQLEREIEFSKKLQE